MKTTLYSIPNWQELARRIGWEDAPRQAEVNAAMQKELSRGHMSFEEQPQNTPVEKGFRVTLKTESVLPKYNKEKTTINVGTNLYDPGIEALLIGMTLGQTAETTAKGEKVSFTVTKVEKKVYPRLTDELVQQLQLENLSTLDAYRAYMTEKLRRDYAISLGNRILESVSAEANMEELSEEDIKAAQDREYEPLAYRFQLEGMSDEEWAKAFGNESFREVYAVAYPDIAVIFGTTDKKSFYESRREAAEGWVHDCVLLRAMLEEQSDACDPTVTLHARDTLMENLQKQLQTMIYGGC